MIDGFVNVSGHGWNVVTVEGPCNPRAIHGSLGEKTPGFLGGRMRVLSWGVRG